MKIGIFGGSFNPPHKVHRQIVETLKKHGYVDKIIIVPTGIHYEYKSNLVDNRYRLDMLHLLFYDLDYVSISDYEMKEYPVYTYQTLDYFNKQYPQDDIYFICGVDNLSYMNEWKHPEVIKKYPLLVLERGNVSIPSCNFDVTMVSFSRTNISSTLVREKVKHKESILSYVPKAIADYILKYQLYKE